MNPFFNQTIINILPYYHIIFSKRNIFIISSLAVAVFFVRSNTFVDLSSCKPRLLKQKKMQFCYVSYVDINGQMFLIKQKRSSRHLLCVVHDAVAAHIAESLDIAHKVDIIPADMPCVGKKHQHWPATIHTLATGATIKEKRTPYKKMNIKQAMSGFRRDMLPWMAKHKDIIKIIALDIFLCNHDRHRGNLFYNAKTNSFCAIDMDLLFKFGLALYSSQNLMKMVEYDLFPITHKEFFALVELRDTLEFLVNTYTPEEIITLFDNYMCKAGLIEGSPLYISHIKSEAEGDKSMIRQNYRECKELIKTLDYVLYRAIQIKPSLGDLQVSERFV